MRFLPYAKHTLDADDVASVVNVLKSDWLTTGPVVEEFETAFAKAVSAPFAVASANGTAALHLAMIALGIQPGDVAVVPSVTFVATANAARYAGAEVLFADVDPDSGLLTPQTFEEALARAPKLPRLVGVVHLGGQTVDMPAVSERAQQDGMTVLEDACHAIGTTSHGEPVGSCRHSDMATFSLHPAKTLTMGEGGVATTQDPSFASRMKTLRSHGLVRDPSHFVQPDEAFDPTGVANPWYYELPFLGYNYRASDIHCALGLSQLKKLESFVSKRRGLVAEYDRHIAALSPTVKPVKQGVECRPAWHLYSVLIDFEALGLSRADVMRALREKGIGTQVHYRPVHRQPYYEARYGKLSLPGADRYYSRQLSLPLFVEMTEEDVARVVDALRSVIH